MEEEVIHEQECIHFPPYSAVFSIYQNVQPQLKAPEKYDIEGSCSFLFQYYVLSNSVCFMKILIMSSPLF